MTDTIMMDTDVCSYILKGNPPQYRKAFMARRHSARICVSVVTYAELLTGAEYKDSKRLREQIASFMELVEITNWTTECARYFSITTAALFKAGTPIGSMDIQIAASALAEGAALVTNNEKHFGRIDGLKVENWLD
ncbi:ribonuclease VapC [Alphaproteobacteria bacterium]|nr:ribonuclease VapC [Alphaproteobacteria bacterium]